MPSPSLCPRVTPNTHLSPWGAGERQLLTALPRCPMDAPEHPQAGEEDLPIGLSPRAPGDLGARAVGVHAGGHRFQGCRSPPPEPPLAARTQQLSLWDRHECRQRPGVTAGAIRSWRAAGKQDDEWVMGGREGRAWPWTGAGSPCCAAGVVVVRRTLEKKGASPTPRSKGELGLIPGSPWLDQGWGRRFVLSLPRMCWGRGMGCQPVTGAHRYQHWGQPNASPGEGRVL